MAGPLLTFFNVIKGSALLPNNTAVVFGDEEIDTQRFGLPAVIVVPRGGPFKRYEPGYSFATDPNVELLWETRETVELWLWNASTTAGQQGAQDHTDAIETLRQAVLSALQDQRAQWTDAANVAYGLQWTAVSGRWMVSTNPNSRYGRAYVLTVEIVIPIAMSPPQEATVLSETFSVSVSGGQHVP